MVTVLVTVAEAEGVLVTVFVHELTVCVLVGHVVVRVVEVLLRVSVFWACTSVDSDASRAMVMKANCVQ